MSGSGANSTIQFIHIDRPPLETSQTKTRPVRILDGEARSGQWSCRKRDMIRNVGL